MAYASIIPTSNYSIPALGAALMVKVSATAADIGLGVNVLGLPNVPNNFQAQAAIIDAYNVAPGTDVVVAFGQYVPFPVIINGGTKIGVMIPGSADQFITFGDFELVNPNGTFDIWLCNFPLTDYDFTPAIGPQIEVTSAGTVDIGSGISFSGTQPVYLTNDITIASVEGGVSISNEITIASGTVTIDEPITIGSINGNVTIANDINIASGQVSLSEAISIANAQSISIAPVVAATAANGQCIFTNNNQTFSPVKSALYIFLSIFNTGASVKTYTINIGGIVVDVILQPGTSFNQIIYQSDTQPIAVAFVSGLDGYSYVSMLSAP